MIVHPQSRDIFVIESDHRASSNEEYEKFVKKMNEIEPEYGTISEK